MTKQGNNPSGCASPSAVPGRAVQRAAAVEMNCVKNPDPFLRVNASSEEQASSSWGINKRKIGAETRSGSSTLFTTSSSVRKAPVQGPLQRVEVVELSSSSDEEKRRMTTKRAITGGTTGRSSTSSYSGRPAAPGSSSGNKNRSTRESTSENKTTRTWCYLGDDGNLVSKRSDASRSESNGVVHYKVVIFHRRPREQSPGDDENNPGSSAPRERLFAHIPSTKHPPWEKAVPEELRRLGSLNIAGKQL